MIDIKHFRIAIVLTTILSILYSLPLGAQSREGARKQMNQGNYSTAITMLTALEELYPGQFSNDLRIARKCLSLQRSAKAKFKAQHFTEAESLYNQILELNPNDRNASQVIIQCQEERNKYWAAEFAKCKTISDYRAFAQQYPNSPQAKTARQKVEDYDLTQQDSNAWAMATRTGTIASFSTYISKANSRAAHLGEAFRNRARLHFNNAINASTDNYRSLGYSSAKSDYENAKQKGAYLWTEDNNKYNACLAEDKFSKLNSYSSSYSITNYISWASSFASNSFVSPHLHLETAYAMLVGAYCRGGRFDDARNVVEQHFGQMTSSYFTMNSIKEWSKSDWKKNIREREKQFKKNHRSTTASHSTSIKTMWGLGASYNLSGFNNDGYLGLNASFSIGTFDNRFNWDFSASPLFLVKKDSYGAEKINFLCPITTGPRLNINKRDGGDFFMALEPEVGYCIGASGVYGGKLIMGYDFFGIGIEALGSMKTLSAGTKWSSNFMYIGFSANFYF